MHMITQELVAFIKQQLQEGKSKEQIANILTPHGWELGDINAVFAQLLPTAAPIVPPMSGMPASTMTTTMQSGSMAQPMVQATMTSNPAAAVGSVMVNGATVATTNAAMGTAPSTMQPVMPSGPQSGFMYSLKNPSAVFAGITLVLNTIASTLLFYYINMNQMATALGAQSQFPSTMDQNSMIAGLLASLMIGIIIGGLITKLVTKILSVTPRTFAQAFTFSSLAMLVTAVFSSLTLLGLHPAVPAVMGIIFWVVFFWYYYSTSIGKAIGAFFINLLVGIIIAGAIIAGAFALGVGMIATLIGGFNGAADVQMTNQQMTLTNGSVRGGVPYLPMELDSSSTVDGGSASGTILTPEDALNALIAENAGATTTAQIGVADSGTPVNPELAHVKDALPVGFPLPKDEQVITAAVLSANTYEGVRYILEYTSTNSLAYLRNNMKTALEKAGYSYSINEKDANYRVITATQVVRGSVRSFRIELIQVGTTEATVKLVFNQ